MKQGLVNKKAVRLDTEIRCLNNTHDSIFNCGADLFYGVSVHFCHFSS